MGTIWVVEDDESIASGLERTLVAEGHTVTRAGSLAEARALRRTGLPELVLLDLGLPDGDGLDLCREIVAGGSSTRVIVLTARADELDLVLGLDAGAVDYVTKPFRLAELLARVRAQLRDRSVADAGARGVTVGDVRVDIEARRVWVGDEEVELRAKEFDLLARLVEDAGSVVRREDLMSDVWDSHWHGSTNTLDVHMASLRRRLGEEAGTPSRITTVRGIGYRLERDPR